jgi:hypothetical protein
MGFSLDDVQAGSPGATSGTIGFFRDGKWDNAAARVTGGYGSSARGTGLMRRRDFGQRDGLGSRKSDGHRFCCGRLLSGACPALLFLIVPTLLGTLFACK